MSALRQQQAADWLAIKLCGLSLLPGLFSPSWRSGMAPLAAH